MKTGFKETNPIPKEKKMNSPWNFDSPPYDERTSCYINAGNHYGVGKKQPTGHHGKAKMESPMLPSGHGRTMEVDSTSTRNEILDIDR